MKSGLIRWTPQTDLFRSRLDRLFDQAFNEFLTPEARTGVSSTLDWMPAVDIKESDEALTLYAEIPGLSKDDVSITLEKNVLTISGERKFEKDVEKENFHRIERAYGSFSRSFSLPANVQTDKVDASFGDGVLTVILPKSEGAKPRQIEIK
jgi:HSP20 family protein